ncbi:MAG TPA: sugar transferase [Candidatus Binatia bacterium]|nr:sugar transferase [Candidatus Binatia bacterium]
MSLENLTARRLVDVVVAGGALVLVGPLLGVLALAVRATSPGPAFFRQARVGRGGRPFLLLKLRTMWHGAAGPSVTGAVDARITPVGRFLRRWKLDELPQLVNIVRGDMTLLGPRPEVPVYLDRLGPAGRDYAALQPGLADAATLVFYDEGELLAGASDPERHYVERILPEKARLSVAYARERTLASDLRLVWALGKRIAGRGAPAPAWQHGHR